MNRQRNSAPLFDTDRILMSKNHHDGEPSNLSHSRDFMVNMIKNAGYTPVERDALYNVVRVYS